MKKQIATKIQTKATTKKATPKKVKKAKTKRTFYTVAGCSRVDGCIYPEVYTDVFWNIKLASKAVAEAVNSVIDDANAEDESLKLEHVKATDCAKGYCLSAFNDADDRFELRIVRHTIELP